MRLRKGTLLLVPLAGLVLASCGGGGGGGGGSTTPPPTVTMGTTISQPATFQNVAVALSVTITPAGPVSWSASSGKLSGGTGTSVLYTPSAAGTFTVTATSLANKSKFVTFKVLSVPKTMALVKGSVRSGGKGVAGIGIRFLNSFNTVIATGSSGSLGDFTVAVPTAAKWMTVNGATIPAAYYNSYQYKGDWFTALVASCRAALPVLKAGVVTTGTDLGLAASSGSPPPPPTGCK